MLEPKEWKEFRNTGLLLIINQLLHVFGWAIVYEFEKEEIIKVYPARVKFRGFDEKSTSDAYVKITSYLKENINQLDEEVKL